MQTRVSAVLIKILLKHLGGF